MPAARGARGAARGQLAWAGGGDRRDRDHRHRDDEAHAEGDDLDNDDEGFNSEGANEEGDGGAQDEREDDNAAEADSRATGRTPSRRGMRALRDVMRLKNLGIGQWRSSRDKEFAKVSVSARKSECSSRDDDANDGGRGSLYCRHGSGNAIILADPRTRKLKTIAGSTRSLDPARVREADQGQEGNEDESSRRRSSSGESKKHAPSAPRRPSEEKSLALLHPRASLQRRVSDRWRKSRLRREESATRQERMQAFMDLEAVNSNGITASEGGAALVALAALLESEDEMDKLRGIVGLRRLLCVEDDPPISQSLAHGVLPAIVGLLESATACDPYQTLAFEACWVLTNLASGSHEDSCAVANAGAVGPLVDLLAFPDEAVAVQAAWALGNISGDGPDLRDLCLAKGAMEGFLELLSPQLGLPSLRTLVWAVSNLCRLRPLAPLERTRLALDPLGQLLLHDDAEISADATWGLAYITDGGAQERVDALLEHAWLLRRLVERLHPGTDATLVTPALRVLGNLVLGTEDQTQFVVDAGVLDHLLPCMTHESKAIRKEALWLLSNVCAGNEAQVQAALDAPGVFSHVVECMTDLDLDLSREGAFAIANAASGGTSDQVDALVLAGAVEALVSYLMVMAPWDFEESSPSVFLSALAIMLHSPLADLPPLDARADGSDDPPIDVLRRVDLLEFLLVCVRVTSDATSERSEELLKMAARMTNFWEEFSFSDASDENFESASSAYSFEAENGGDDCGHRDDDGQDAASLPSL